MRLTRPAVLAVEVDSAEIEAAAKRYYSSDPYKGSDLKPELGPNGIPLADPEEDYDTDYFPPGVRKSMSLDELRAVVERRYGLPLR